MKKLLSLFAALLLCFLAHSQEAEVTGSHAEVAIVPRLDLNPYHSEDSKLGFTHGNSSIYTLFEGTAGEHFSWTLANHWLSSLNEPASPDFNYGWPYANLGYSCATNWIDFCKIDLTFGNWDFTLGKDAISTLGFEYDPWDWEVYYDFTTPLWNFLPGYQWGVKAAYTTNSGLSTFSAQMVSSPYGERAFSSGLWAYSAQWKGEYGFFEPIWSYSAIQYDGGLQHVVALGNRFSFSDELSLTVDWVGAFSKDDQKTVEEIIGDTALYNCIRGQFTFAPSERFDISLHSYWHKPQVGDALFNIGALAQFFPLKDSQDLRLHAACSYNAYFKTLSLTLGALYYIRIRCW